MFENLYEAWKLKIIYNIFKLDYIFFDLSGRMYNMALWKLCL